MILGKLRKEAALYATIAIAGVAAGLVRTFFAIRFLLNLWLSLALRLWGCAARPAAGQSAISFGGNSAGFFSMILHTGETAER